MNSLNPRPEDKVIEAFVRYLAKKLYPGLQVLEWPDKKNAGTSDIDAVAQATGRRIAIEHTSADWLPDQRLHDDRFMKVIGYLEDELKGELDYRLTITIPFGTVPTGISWIEVRNRLRGWIFRDVPLLPYGIKHDIRLDGVPFLFTLYKSNSCVHGLFFARSVTEDTDFGQRLQSQIERKATKLAKYRDNCDLLILLIENNDLANMNRGIMMKAVAESFGQSLPSGLDRIWYADSSISDCIHFWNITPSSRTQIMHMNALEELEEPPD